MNLDISTAISVAGQTAAALYAAMPTKVLLLVIGLLFCFVGYKLLRWASALYGVVIGVTLGACLTSLFGSSMAESINLVLTMLAMVLLGMLLGVLCFRFCRVGVFLLCACIGAAVGYIPALLVQDQSWVAFAVILAVCALLFGVTGVLFLRMVGILTTSLFGLAAAFPLMALLHVQSRWLTILVGIGLTVVGCMVQLLTNRDAGTSPLAGGRKKDVLAEEVIPNADGAHLREDAEDRNDDTTQVLNVSDFTDEPDEIDAISDHVAAHIDMTQPCARTQPLNIQQPGETMPFDQPAGISDDPEEVDDRTMLLTLKEDSKKTAVQHTSEEPALETQAAFAWMTEDPIEPTVKMKQNETENRPPWNEDGASADTLVHNIWGGSQPQTEPLSGTQQPEAEENAVPSGFWNDVLAPEAVAEQETEGRESTEPTEVLEATEPTAEPIEAEESTEVSKATEPTAEPVEAKEPARKNHSSKEMILSVVLVAVTLAYAAIGTQHTELLLALCFGCYLLQRYYIAAFSCAVLCVRSAVDVVMAVRQYTGWQTIVQSAVCCAVFLALTAAAVSKGARAKQENLMSSDETEE